MIRVAVTGAAGRMGSGIIRKVTEQEDMEVVAAIEMPNTPLAGKDAGLQAGIDELGPACSKSHDMVRSSVNHAMPLHRITVRGHSFSMKAANFSGSKPGRRT